MERAKLLHYAPGALVAIEIPFQIGCEVNFQQTVQKLKPDTKGHAEPLSVVSPAKPPMPGFSGIGGVEILPTKRKSHYDNIVEKLERKYVSHAYNPTESPDPLNVPPAEDDDSSADEDGNDASSSSDHQRDSDVTTSSLTSLKNVDKLLGAGQKAGKKRTGATKRRFVEYYDDADGFIDDSEALESAEQAIRMTTTRTKHSGFFVSSGVLETVAAATVPTTVPSVSVADQSSKKKRDRSGAGGVNGKHGPPTKKRDKETESAVKAVGLGARPVLVADAPPAEPAHTEAKAVSDVPKVSVPPVSPGASHLSPKEADTSMEPSASPTRPAKPEVSAVDVIAQWQRGAEVSAALVQFSQACAAYCGGEFAGAKPVELKASHPFPRRLDAALGQLDTCVAQYDKKALGGTAYCHCISAALGEVMSVGKVKSSLKRVRARRVAELAKAAILVDLVPLVRQIRTSIVEAPPARGSSGAKGSATGKATEAVEVSTEGAAPGETAAEAAPDSSCAAPVVAPYKWKVKWSIEMKSALLTLEERCAEWYLADVTYRRALNNDDTKFEAQQADEERAAAERALAAAVESDDADAWATDGVAFRQVREM